jgi:F-type H+-transporting ATPase subunit a
MAEKLLEELQIELLFTIPVWGGIPVFESVVVSWIIIGVLALLCIWLTHGLKVKNPGKRQIVAEFLVTWLENFIGGMLGEDAKEYTQYMASVLFYIGFANIIGIFGFKPPAKDMNITIAVALMSIVLIEFAGIKARRFGGWIKSFTQPIAIVTPINILEIAIRPLSLCMRLFGNVLGAFVIMELIEILIPVGVPMVFSLYFDIFDGFIQAYVFVFLTSLFIQEAVEVHKEEGGKQKRKKLKNVKAPDTRGLNFKAEGYQK